MRRCASTVRAISPRSVSTSVASQPMPALPPESGTSTTSKLHGVPATITAARRVAATPPVRLRSMAARVAASSNSRPAATALDRVRRLDRPGIARIDEDDPAGGIANPDRRRQRLDHAAQRIGLGAELLVAMREIGEVALDAAHVLQLEHGAAADRAAFGGEVAAGGGGERNREALAPPEQPVDMGLQMQRLLGPQPGSEGQQLVRREARSDERRIADDLRSGVVVPAHHHLRLGEHEVVEPVDLAVECRNRRGGARPLCVQAVMGAHQEHGAHHREEQHADEERERGDLVLVERLEGVEIGEPDG